MKDAFIYNSITIADCEELYSKGTKCICNADDKLVLLAEDK